LPIISSYKKSSMIVQYELTYESGILSFLFWKLNNILHFSLMHIMVSLASLASLSRMYCTSNRKEKITNFKTHSVNYWNQN
jgi:hypothetical protein